MESGEVTDTRHLGSTLIAAMIREAEQVCHPCFDEDRDYHQVISKPCIMKIVHNEAAIHGEVMMLARNGHSLPNFCCKI